MRDRAGNIKRMLPGIKEGLASVHYGIAHDLKADSRRVGRRFLDWEKT